MKIGGWVVSEVARFEVSVRVVGNCVAWIVRDVLAVANAPNVSATVSWTANVPRPSDATWAAANVGLEPSTTRAPLAMVQV